MNSFWEKSAFVDSMPDAMEDMVKLILWYETITDVSMTFDANFLGKSEFRWYSDQNSRCFDHLDLAYFLTFFKFQIYFFSGEDTQDVILHL